MLEGLAHTAICVSDVDAAVEWYRDVLGLRVLSPPYRMAGEEIERDMGDLIPSPVVVKAAIMGFGDNDRVLELIEYPEAMTPASEIGPESEGGLGLTTPGLTHVGFVCDDVHATRAELKGRGVEFLTTGVVDVASLRTTWFRDPWGNVFILLGKRLPDRPYWRQYGDR